MRKKGGRGIWVSGLNALALAVVSPFALFVRCLSCSWHTHTRSRARALGAFFPRPSKQRGERASARTHDTSPPPSPATSSPRPASPRCRCSFFPVLRGCTTTCGMFGWSPWRSSPTRSGLPWATTREDVAAVSRNGFTTHGAFSLVFQRNPNTLHVKRVTAWQLGDTGSQWVKAYWTRVRTFVRLFFLGDVLVICIVRLLLGAMAC